MRSADVLNQGTALLYCCLCAGWIAVQTLEARPFAQSVARLTLDEVLRVVRAGESEELIVARIKRNGRPFDLSVDERAELKREGVSDEVVKYLVDPSLPYTPPAPKPAPAPRPATRNYPDDEFASRIPAESGAYLPDVHPLDRIDLKTLMTSKEGGLGNLLSAGLIRRKVLGHLVGGMARRRVTSLPAIFYLRLGEPGKIEEVALAALEATETMRELEFSSDKGQEAKATLRVDVLQPFDVLEVGPSLYRITVPKLRKGEYLFYLIGSADPQKGIQGKGYDFGVN